MFRSAGQRFIMVGVLALLMSLPLNLVSGVVQDRADYSRSTVAMLSSEWGGDQLFSGPLLTIPVTEEVTYDRRREAVDALTGLTLRDDKGNAIYEHYEETVTEDRNPIYLYAETFDMEMTTETQTRYRGIFEVPVYTADIAMTFDFDLSEADDMLTGQEVAHWDDAHLRVFLSSNKALRGEAVLEADGRSLRLEPISGSKEQTGVTTRTGDPRDVAGYSMSLGINGAQTLAAAATGRTTRMTMKSDWPDPSFYGAFLPDESTVSETGFEATWVVPHLARSLPQISRSYPDTSARQSASMGVRFITPNDFYQKAWRSARYGILFIALTFLTILMLERTAERRAHPVQYLMVGLVQSVFVLLMVAYAEQFGFGSAYLLAAGATIGLLTVFGATALKLGSRTVTLTGVLVAVYGVLFLILQSADYAFLAGSTLAFVALALTMWMTRNEDWQGPERTGSRWSIFRRPPKPPVAEPSA
ncbi:MAG: cell envelope integrity protein CreD [Rhodobacteraceae bacterium]|nr:MAG: cell envelope integrity protein CreD [Paracoccaceae bacterium]